MAFPTPKFLFRSTGIRVFLAKQVLFFVVAVALFAILWVTGVRSQGMGFVPILLYGLFIGNFTTLIMNRVAVLCSRLRAPFDWVVYLMFLFVTAVAGTALTVLIIMAVYRIPIRFFLAQLWSTGRLIVLVILIVGSIRYLYRRTRVRLEGKNLELQRAVEMGNTRSKQQEQEMDKAREIQEGLLPKKIPQVRGLEVAGAWQPASVVGGDYFDVLKFSDTKIGICIGDVVGKGISAALLMANLQASFRAFASEEVPAGTLVGKLNDVVANNIAADKFVTFCYCTIDTTKTGSPMRARVTGRRSCSTNQVKEFSLREGGAPLGSFRTGITKIRDFRWTLATGWCSIRTV